MFRRKEKKREEKKWEQGCSSNGDFEKEPQHPEHKIRPPPTTAAAARLSISASPVIFISRASAACTGALQSTSTAVAI